MLDAPILLFISVTAVLILSAISVYKWPKLERVLCTCWMIFSVALFFGPSLWALAWQVQHGNHIEFEGRSFRIPFRWIAVEAGADGSFQHRLELKSPASNLFLVFWNRSFYADHISLGPLLTMSKTPTSDGKLKAWRDMFSSLHVGVRDILLSPTSTGSEPDDVACVEVIDSSSARSVHASCLILRNGYTAEFIGKRKNMDIFVELVRNANLLRDNPSVSGRVAHPRGSLYSSILCSRVQITPEFTRGGWLRLWL
jgi:hypothetical protein